MENEKEELTIYEKLVNAVEKLPKEAVETAPKEITRKGYDTTGYGYQFLVNVMNEVLGIENWTFEYSVLKETEGKWTNGKSFWEITSLVKVTIITGKGQLVKSMPGGHKAEMYSDALKGSITNGLKKTLAMFGIGKKAYEGTIDEDYRPLPQGDKMPLNAPQSPTRRQDTAGVPNCSICGKPMKPTKSGAKNPFWCKHGAEWGKPVYPKTEAEQILGGEEVPLPDEPF